MGIGTLRRHHEAGGAAREVAPSTLDPVVEQHAEGADEVRELRAEVARLTSANASLIEQARLWKAEAVALGWEKPQAENAPESDAQGQPEGNDGEQAEVESEGDGGNIPETPARSAKTAAWVEYAEANPTDPPLNLTPRSGLRDIIVAHYLGE